MAPRTSDQVALRIDPHDAQVLHRHPVVAHWPAMRSPSAPARAWCPSRPSPVPASGRTGRGSSGRRAKSWRFITPGKPLPLEVPTTSTRSPGLEHARRPCAAELVTRRRRRRATRAGASASAGPPCRGGPAPGCSACGSRRSPAAPRRSRPRRLVFIWVTKHGPAWMTVTGTTRRSRRRAGSCPAFGLGVPQSSLSTLRPFRPPPVAAGGAAGWLPAVAGALRA